VLPERVRRDEARVVGIQAQTSSLLEADPATAAVPGLWRRFQDERLGDRIPGRVGARTTCAVYSDYQDAGDGERRFSALVGAEATEAGDYLVFAARGPMPAALAATWERIAEFFEHAPVTRAFTADLEVHYPAGSAVDVFVAIDGG
jgi:predicted transcriptional regulator YdeE